MKDKCEYCSREATDSILLAEDFSIHYCPNHVKEAVKDEDIFENGVKDNKPSWFNWLKSWFKSF